MKKVKLKKFLTATNILLVVLTIFYLLDHYLPLPQNYTGFSWATEQPNAIGYVFGFCGGLLTNHLGIGKVLDASGTEVYRYVTQMFLHGHLLHFIANFVGLYFIGNYAEKRFGWWKAYAAYFVVGIVEVFITDSLYVAMAPSKAEEVANAVSVGASGGIFALVGVSLAALFFNIKSFKQIPISTIIVSAIYGVLTTYVASFGWTTVCHNVCLVLGLALGVVAILPFFILKKGKYARASTEQSDNNKCLS